MKASLIVSAGIALGLVGCTSSHVSSESGEFAQKTGVYESVWGERPTYDTRPLLNERGRFDRASGSKRMIAGTVIADLLVDRDGTVRDVHFVDDGGDAALREEARAMLRELRFTSLSDPAAPAPYVVPNFRLRLDRQGAQSPIAALPTG